MKKLLSVFALVLLMCGCSEKAGFIGKNYQLQNAQNGVKVTLAFAADEPRYFGAVVNRYFGTYELNGSKIKFGPAGVTMMMGPEKEMEAEQNFLGILPHIVSYKMVGSSLVLITDNGQELGFKEIPAE
ncbi:MAG: META domain-containing protein [Alphaproteobacteria bacterium]|nr:META domain-containing protein [Alphaproteobacteria bacterium]